MTPKPVCISRAAYRRLFVDEFQDTDPLQVEIVQLLARRDPAGQFAPGALFVVGDPKQSIYAFRRADIQMTEQFRKFAQIDEASLTANFRSRGAILSWVNQRFRSMDGRRRTVSSRLCESGDRACRFR